MLILVVIKPTNNVICGIVWTGIHDMSSALRRAVKRSVSEPEDANDETEGESGANEEDPAPDNQSILRLLEENEKVKEFICLSLICSF